MPFARRKQCNARKSTNIPYRCRRCRKSPHITPCGKASRHCISTNSRPKHSVSCAKGQKQGPENGAVTETLNKQLFLNLPYVLNNSENTPELSMNSKGTQRSQAFVLHSIFCTPRHISPAESTDDKGQAILMPVPSFYLMPIYRFCRTLRKQLLLFSNCIDRWICQQCIPIGSASNIFLPL